MEEQVLKRSADSVATKNRIRGAILGAACANSLAGSCIGLNYKEILGRAGSSHLREFSPGLSKSKRPDHKPGELLSDTLLGLSLADVLIENQGRLKIDALKANFTSLLEREAFLASSPGSTRLMLLRSMIDARLAGERGLAMHSSGATRTFAAGCLPGEPDTDEPAKIAASQAALTLADSSVQAAAAVVADSVHYLILGGVLDTAEKVRQYVKHEFELAEKISEPFAEAWDDVAPDLNYAQPAQELPYSLVNVVSSVNELVPTAVGIFLIFRHSFEDAVCAAARAGGSTDEVAVIVGALAGACHGATAIPSRWLEQIAERERLENISLSLYRLWEAG